MRIAAVFAAAASAAPGPARAAAETYRFDLVHTQVLFAVDHQRFSRPHGRLRVREGWFQFDPADWSSARVDVVVDLASLDLGDAKWNDTATSGQLLDAARWPTARYTSRSIEQTDANHGVVHGDLTFHGVTRALDLAITLNRVGNDPYAFRQKAGFSATATLPRFDFGITRYKDVIGADVELRIEVEGLRDRDAAAPEKDE
ncbi:YceI family protein [Dokdonella fugitiva]|jgi:polyisoprenoid-binding protein YceI|uniref:Polyisoprenoid-binding protein YceI n=1 Tax=Dokdonella fugitiva TaxID=328517 RepID=A0A4V2S1N4_9GAMM|nr:YceI family protein [Dokdonella fugitiva]MBA8884571.1 polyisoprenoid-binding protein YceI [Dokdonella fugitiva]TCO37240.1 polyisoprenoid-binding protein YceI [Dokdonella fugitiva]